MDIEIYDAVISLGGLCATAKQLQRRNLRPRSLGLDWAGIPFLEGIPLFINGFQRDFADLCLKENLKWVNDPIRSHGFFDTSYQFSMVHTFRKPPTEQDWYEADIATFRKRMRRLFDICDNAQRVLFVFATRIEFDLQLCEDLRAALSRRFPRLDFRLRVLQFGSTAGPFYRDLGKGNVSIFRYPRQDSFSYDIDKTSVEWEFLDHVALRAHQVRQKPPKLLYRIWKHCSRKLRDCGCDLDYEISRI